MQRITVGFIVIAILALALLWALPVARAQQTTLPVIEYLSSRSPSESAHIVTLATRHALPAVGGEHEADACGLPWTPQACASPRMAMAWSRGEECLIAVRRIRETGGSRHRDAAP